MQILYMTIRGSSLLVSSVELISAEILYADFPSWKNPILDQGSVRIFFFVLRIFDDRKGLVLSRGCRILGCIRYQFAALEGRMPQTSASKYMLMHTVVPVSSLSAL
jgi:hypothetical protein